MANRRQVSAETSGASSPGRTGRRGQAVSTDHRYTPPAKISSPPPVRRHAAPAPVSAPATPVAPSEDPRVVVPTEPVEEPQTLDWTITDADLESDRWQLRQGEVVTYGRMHTLLEAAKDLRKSGHRAPIIAPDGTNEVPAGTQLELRIAKVASGARSWRVELQNGGVTQLIAKGTKSNCEQAYKSHAERLEAGTVVMYDPYNEPVPGFQKARPQYRTTVTTPDDDAYVRVDDQGPLKYLRDQQAPWASAGGVEKNKDASPSAVSPVLAPSLASSERPPVLVDAAGVPVLSLLEAIFVMQERVMLDMRQQASRRASTLSTEQCAGDLQAALTRGRT